MCYCDDYDGPKVFNRSIRRARKPHRCSECWRAIGVGERYEEHSGLWDGGWSKYPWCSHCSAAVEVIQAKVSEYNRTRDRSRFSREHEWCLCWSYGEFWSEFEETAIGSKRFDLYRLIVSARRKWTVRRGSRKGQLMAVPQCVAVPAATVS